MQQESKQHKIKWRPPGKVATAFFKSKAFIRGISGPIGSGKSVCCMNRLFATACTQVATGGKWVGGKYVGGVRKTRFAMIRNTYPELESTTIKTWLEWFPESVFGAMRRDIPLTHHIVMPLPDGTTMDCEVMFFAVDRPDQAKKLLSLELTAAFMNESRELEFSTLEAITGRLGRYPAQKDRPEHIAAVDWPTECYLAMDTNAPMTGSWWYNLAEPDAKGGADIRDKLDILAQDLVKLGAIKAGQPLVEFFKQPSGLSKDAENLGNLRVGYYQFSSINKTEEWIKVHVHNEYGVSYAGKRVYQNYSDDLHLAKAKLLPMKGVPLRLAFDFGHTPACVIGLLTPMGQLRVIGELVTEDMFLQDFMDGVVIPHLLREFPGINFDQVLATGDPAGDTAEDSSGQSCAKILKKYFKLYKSASTNDVMTRLNAVSYFLSRNINGEAAFKLSPGCVTIHEGFLGGYHYKKLNTSAETRYSDLPNKNRFSHPHDCVQYLAMQAAPHHEQTRTPRAASRRSVIADARSGY
jgi:hypothetical protein